MAQDKFNINNSRDRDEFVQNFWLNLGNVHEIKTSNLIGRHPYFYDNPSLAIVDLMSRPENFGYTCSILFDYHLHPMQIAILKMLWHHPFSVFTATRGGSKTTLLAIYSLLRAIFIPNSKILFIGNAFRQSKLIFAQCEQIYYKSPMLQDILGKTNGKIISHNVDMFQLHIYDSTVTSIPLGSGEKIRGQRSTCTLCDEFNTLDETIYQEVIQGFSAVALNPIEQVRERAKYEALYKLGEINKASFEENIQSHISNQQIIAGTCGYVFQPLYKMWKRYHDIIVSRGDQKKIAQIFNGEIPAGFSHKDYAIARLPYDIYPKGYIDEKSIGRAKVTTHSGIFNSEYCVLFLTDSQGFFKRSLIEGAVCGNKLSRITKKCGDIDFTILMQGYPNAKYVIGVDPASQTDNFAIVILEIWEDHRRVVYSWTTNNHAHKQKIKHGIINEHNYYVYCATKIRELMKLFNIEEIVMDAQGGGRAIAEVLGDPNHLKSGEHPLYPVVELEKPRVTDHLAGRHMIHMIEFRNLQWTSNANHNLKQDLETHELIFPACGSAEFGFLHEQDVMMSRIKEHGGTVDDLYETSEDVLLEIEEMKNELALIEYTTTPNGSERWDTPAIKGANSKKGRLRKDRYSALLLANAVGRTMIPRTMDFEYKIIGGFAKNLVNIKSPANKMIPDMANGYSFGVGIKRK